MVSFLLSWNNLADRGHPRHQELLESQYVPALPELQALRTLQAGPPTATRHGCWLQISVSSSEILKTIHTKTPGHSPGILFKFSLPRPHPTLKSVSNSHQTSVLGALFSKPQVIPVCMQVAACPRSVPVGPQHCSPGALSLDLRSSDHTQPH